MSAVNMVDVDMREVREELGFLAKRSYNLSDVTAQIAQILRVYVEDKFENEGPGWPPMTLETMNRRRGGNKLLQDTGVLVNSISVDSGIDFAEVFTNVPYSKHHIEGTRYMPKRDFFDIDQQEVLRIAADIIVDAIAR